MLTLRRIVRLGFGPAAGLFLTLIAAAAAVLSAQSSKTQTNTAAAGARTAFGQPNLEGVWSFATLTPLERPADLAGKAILTEKEAVDYERRLLQQFDHDTAEGAERVCKGTGNYNEFWYDRGSSIVKTRRTSLIIDPADGKIPPLTPEGIARRDARAAARKGRGPADSWEDRGLAERCIIGFNAGPPMMPSAYNNNFQLFLSAHYAVILTEMVHDARIVPLDGRPALGSSISQWAGSSRGHWDGDTLIVETRNFTDKTGYQGSGEKLRLIERFRRADADTLMYEFTVDDPSTFTRPWTAQIPMTRVPGQLFEYACHEGNYGLAGILSGHRAEEQAGARP
jgi:hypothetical protein